MFRVLHPAQYEEKKSLIIKTSEVEKGNTALINVTTQKREEKIRSARV